MANQNLSQFGEKLFVADADHTFIWDSEASISKRVSRNSWLNSGTLTSDAPVTISQTWNNAAVAFTGLKFNAAGTSDANSASGSRLLDLQLNGVSKLSVTKAGTINFGEVQANFDPYISRVALGTLAISLYGFNQNHVSMGYSGGGSSLPGVTVSSGGHFAWSSSSTNSEAARDTILVRDSASGNTLALRNGALAQTFRVYNTYSNGGVDFERLDIGYSSGVARVLSSGAGSGAHRALTIGTGTGTWQFFTSGSFLALADNTYDIGASGANRPKNVYVGSNVISRPAASITPANNGEFVVEATSDTTLTFKLKGTDGTVRSGTITLSV